MHRTYVEARVADEEKAIRADGTLEGRLVRLERRELILVVELRRAVYTAARHGQTGPSVPLLGQRRDATIVARLDCENFDTDPPSFAFVADWETLGDLPYAAWPKGSNIVERHHKTGRPFLCIPGIREFHSHFQHGDQPWDRYRGKMGPRDVVRRVANELLTKQIFT